MLHLMGYPYVLFMLVCYLKIRLSLTFYYYVINIGGLLRNIWWCKCRGR